MSPEDEVETTGRQPGSWWLFLRLVWVRRWTGAKPALPSISGQEALMGCGSPLVRLPWAGWQLLQWVLRTGWLARPHGRDTGKGWALRTETIQNVFPNSSLVFPWYSTCAGSWPGGSRGGGRSLVGHFPGELLV